MVESSYVVGGRNMSYDEIMGLVANVSSAKQARAVVENYLGVFPITSEYGYIENAMEYDGVEMLYQVVLGFRRTTKRMAKPTMKHRPKTLVRIK